MSKVKLQRKTAWAEDRALLSSNLSADPGAKTEERAGGALISPVRLPLRDWRQSDKPSRQEAVTRRQDVAYQLANARRDEFQFTVNQDTSPYMSDEPVDLEALAVRMQPPATLWRRATRTGYVLRYYRKPQIVRRVIQRLTPEFWARRRYQVRLEQPAELREGAIESLGRIARARVVHTDQDMESLLADLQLGTLTLLADRRELGTPIDWEANLSPRPSHLWRFHLHYHEYLLDLACGLRETDVDPWPTIWATIGSWINAHPVRQATRRSDAWHAYCISRRLPVWAQLAALQSPPEGFSESLLTSMAEQATVLSQCLEFDLGGNHLLENLRALALAGCLLDGPASERWLDTAEQQLRRELPEQILPHGEHFERAPMYHCQVLGNLLQIAIAAETVRPSLAKLCRGEAQRMLDFLTSILHPDGEIPLLGDSCFGEAHSVEEIRPLASEAGLETPREPSEGATIAGPYWVWRSGRDAVIFDAGEAAAMSLPAHGHADLLGFEASLGGERLLVDSGLFGYDDDAMRTYCRSSLAHNVVTIDEQNCCDLWSKFRMGHRGRVVDFRHGRDGDWHWAQASHDGYRQFGLGRWTRLFAARSPSIVACIDIPPDSFAGRRLTGRLHLAPGANAEIAHEQVCLVTLQDEVRRLHFGDGVQLSLLVGWQCSRFGRRLGTSVIQYTLTTESDPPIGLGWALSPLDEAVTLEVTRTGQTPLVRLGMKDMRHGFERLLD